MPQLLQQWNRINPAQAQNLQRIPGELRGHRVHHRHHMLARRAAIRTRAGGGGQMILAQQYRGHVHARRAALHQAAHVGSIHQQLLLHEGQPPLAHGSQTNAHIEGLQLRTCHQTADHVGLQLHPEDLPGAVILSTPGQPAGIGLLSQCLHEGGRGPCLRLLAGHLRSGLPRGQFAASTRPEIGHHHVISPGGVLFPAGGIATAWTHHSPSVAFSDADFNCHSS